MRRRLEAGSAHGGGQRVTTRSSSDGRSSERESGGSGSGCSATDRRELGQAAEGKGEVDEKKAFEVAQALWGKWMLRRKKLENESSPDEKP